MTELASAPLNETDRAVLSEMADRERHNAPELAALTNADRNYINTRLRHLASWELVEAVEHSRGMYTISDRGHEVVES